MEAKAPEELLDALHEPVLMLNQSLTITALNRAYERAFGVDRSAVRGRSIFEIHGATWDSPSLRDRLDALAEHGTAVECFMTEVAPFGRLALNARRFAEAGQSRLVLALDGLSTAEAKPVQTTDLRHRFKNAIALVEVTALRTLLDAQGFEAFRLALAGRIRALSRVHGRLLADAWEPVTVRELAEECLEVCRVAAERASLSGPPCELPRPYVLALSLILHELCTNAVKHGALAGSNGHLHIDWQVPGADHEQVLQLTWRESGRAGVSAPTHRGYGLELIESLAKYDLGARLEMNYPATGLVCSLEFELTREPPRDPQ
jgi:two-component sensor histidine kinase